MPRPLPKTPKEWLQEIREAMQDARDAIPFAPLAGTQIAEADLFQLAPLVCLKFRGRKTKKKEQDRVVEGALANYIANRERGLEASTEIAFALCYVAAHFVLDLIDENEAQRIMTYCEDSFG
jgi:hypothetical protein